MNKQYSKKNLILSIGVVLIGVLAIVFAVLCWCDDSLYAYGSLAVKYIYGGDAYTGIQQAAAEAANNVYYLNCNIETISKILTTCMGYLLFIIGIMLCIIGISKIVNNPQKDNAKTETNLKITENTLIDNELS